MQKAVFESTKKKEVGVSDLTLISKITNEAINENLKKRFENKEIYVSFRQREGGLGVVLMAWATDVHWACVDLGKPVSRFGDLYR